MTTLKECNQLDFDPFQLPPVDYLGMVECACQSTHEGYSQALNCGIRMGGSRCLIVVGSDGKLERHSQSKSEFVLVSRQIVPQSLLDGIYDTLSKFEGVHFEKNTSYGIEIKILEGTSPFSYANHESATVYPDRILNSAFITGDVTAYAHARMRVLREITASDSLGQRIRDHMYEQLKQYKRAILTREFRHIPLFSLTDHQQFYSEGVSLCFGFKIPFLRSVQRYIDIATTRLIRRGLISIHDCVDMPTSTYDRLIFLHRSGYLPSDIAANAGYAYGWFLREYHRAQELFKRSSLPTATSFDPDEFNEYARAIKRLLKITQG
ncbi:hypothetical protein A2154_05135 [Candidatus Gottesmanbacteria bacterium RBG_16_43_7]|uniref:Uncharacterized protein n=1 Tax=Candidatus Gottesmanbacteria bacterium RBG_16_43_7 TaxID=1798373 RepID=A0A1F5ZCB5_9BACT|nr:MAG: hypothetical protein A2154_05135 [Candidatus Gottesmanbacteria bacterium RBG_16_43_7]